MNVAQLKQSKLRRFGEMIRREPELLSLVELSVATDQARQGKTLDVEAYRRQVHSALRHGSPRSVEKELRSLLELAARLDEAGDWLNAGAIYHAVLDETVSGYENELSEMDEDGDIAAVIDEFALRLSQCLKKNKTDDETRRAWLGALLDAELADREIGGIGMAPCAREAVLEQATDQEWEWIEARIETAISKAGNWPREELSRFLAARRKRHVGTGKATAKKRTRKSPL